MSNTDKQLDYSLTTSFFVKPLTKDPGPSTINWQVLMDTHHQATPNLGLLLDFYHAHPPLADADWHTD